MPLREGDVAARWGIKVDRDALDAEVAGPIAPLECRDELREVVVLIGNVAHRVGVGPSAAWAAKCAIGLGCSADGLQADVAALDLRGGQGRTSAAVEACALTSGWVGRIVLPASSTAAASLKMSMAKS